MENSPDLFLSENVSFKNYVIEVISNEFPNLISEHTQLIVYYTLEIIDILAEKFNFKLEESEHEYIYQFKQNNNRDINAIVNMLLPYIDDPDNNKKKDIVSFDDLYIDKNLNKFKYTNVQYSRCIRPDDESGLIKYMHFDKQHLLHNFILLSHTIILCSNKLYVNWTNIFPISQNNYKDYDFYKNTKKSYLLTVLDMTTDINSMTELSKYIPDNISADDHQEYVENRIYTFFDDKKRQLPLDDIYNTISHDLFNNVKNYEWLIYDFNVHSKPYPTIIVLNNIINLETLLLDKDWDEVDTSKFTSDWNNLLLSIELDKNIGKLNVNTLKRLINIIFTNIQNNSKDIRQLEKNNLYEKLMLEYTDLGVDDGVLKNFDKVLNKIKLIPIKYIYKYLQSIINDFKKTWYADSGPKGTYTLENDVYLIRDNKIKSLDDDCYINIDYLEGENNSNYLTYYMIYVFSKNICSQYIPTEEKHHKKMSMGKYFKSLSLESKKQILNRICSNEINWFSIRKYNNKKHKEVTNWTFFEIQKMLIDIIFIILVRKGVLSYFEPCKELTDKKIYNGDFRKQKIKDNKENYLNAYYYLTNEPYKNLQKNDDGEHYFDLLVKENWPNIYALDWLSQINFYHKYLNCRVIFTTGATGVGKSTQIPKLLMYAIKMLDYKNNGKVICTEPRVPPTENNAKRVSEELGVPIKKHNKIYDKMIPTLNFSVQYKHQQSKHTNNNQKYYLKFVTDGTLLEELVSQPLLKIKYKDTYSTENIYDGIIIDEAHEHNPNMDFILTLMQYAAYYNNELKLIIMSATMDDDEPRYRNYYRCINDNRMYPFNSLLNDPPETIYYMDDTEIKLDGNLDRINIDRRLHISPPGETTNHKITEYYEEKIDTWKIAFKKGIERTINIMNTTIDGDILFFVTGVMDILKACEIINKGIPGNAICLPFHSSISDSEKLLIDNVSYGKDDITIDKSEVNKQNKNQKTVPKGTYKRVVIVATNLAEASLTISSLKYVVDPGYAKVAEYDFTKRSSKLIIKKISNSSSKQRSGRVGRKSAGTVYKMHGEYARSDLPTEYNIANENVSESLYKLLCNSNKDESLIPEKYNINVRINEYNIDEIGLPYGIDKIFDLQYYFHDIYKMNDFFGNDKHENYNYKGYGHMPVNRLISGYTKDVLLDGTGCFYIVHPIENKLKRNVMGKLNELDDIHHSNLKLLDFFDILKEKLLIVDGVSEYENTADLLNTKKNYISDTYKTDYGINLLKINKTVKMQNINDLIIYLHSFIYNCNDEVLHILNMIGDSMGSWYRHYEYKGRSVPLEKEFKGLYGNKYGDYIALYKIHKNFENVFQHKLKLFNNNIDITSIRVEFNKYKQIYNEHRDDLPYLYNNIPRRLYLELRELYNDGVLNEEDDYGKYLSKGWRYLIDDLDKYADQIEHFCKTNYINTSTLIRYIKQYAHYKYQLIYNDYRETHSILDEHEEKSDLINTEWFKKNMIVQNKGENMNENILLSFVYGDGYNLGRIVDKNLYVNISNKHLLSGNFLNEPLKIYETTMNKQNNYIMYHTEDIRQYERTNYITISFINNIKLEWIINLIPFSLNLKEIQHPDYLKAEGVTIPTKNIVFKSIKDDIDGNIGNIQKSLINITSSKYMLTPSLKNQINEKNDRIKQIEYEDKIFANKMKKYKTDTTIKVEHYANKKKMMNSFMEKEHLTKNTNKDVLNDYVKYTLNQIGNGRETIKIKNYLVTIDNRKIIKINYVNI
jgi:hypothetical protein